MFLGPFDARRHHDHGEAALVDQGCVFDDREVDIGDLVNVEMKIPFEDALPFTIMVSTRMTTGDNLDLPNSLLHDFGPGVKIRLSRAILKA